MGAEGGEWGVLAARGGPRTGVGRGVKAASPSAQPLRLRDIVSGLTGNRSDTAGAGRITFLVAAAPAGLAPAVTIVLVAFMVPVGASGGDRMTGVSGTTLGKDKVSL